MRYNCLNQNCNPAPQKKKTNFLCYVFPTYKRFTVCHITIRKLKQSGVYEPQGLLSTSPGKQVALAKQRIHKT